MTRLKRAEHLLRTRVLTAADTWERHLIVADLVGDARQVLDVGGIPGQLAGYLPRACVVAANIATPADLLVAPGELPFKDRAIEVVTSLDALEHIPQGERSTFIAELMRVTRRRLVLCCPLGMREHAAAERDVQAWHREMTGQEHPWLAEHLSLGLPRHDELEAWLGTAACDGDAWSLRFHGDYRVTNRQFKRIVTARRRPTPVAMWTFVRERITHRPDTALFDHPSPWTNRMFAVVDRPTT